MASFVLTHKNWSTYLARFEKIEDATPRQWGQMDAPRMIRHLRRIVEISLAELPVEDQSNWYRRTIFCWLVFHVFPWPKGKIKVPDVYLPKPDGNVAEERGKLLEIMERFLSAADKEPRRRTTHPMFGPRTMENWRLIHGKHFDHHLRQFGA